MNIRASLSALVLSAVYSVPVVALAQSAPVPVPGRVITLTTVVYLVQRIINVGIVLATLAVVAMIVYAGFKMATAAGDDAAFKKGKETLKYAIYGALVVFGVGLIVNTIARFAANPESVIY